MEDDELYDHLNSGYQAGRGAESPSLQAISARWNEQAQTGMGRPQSVLSQLSPSPVAANLSAPSQRDRLLPNGFQLPNNSQGSSPETAMTTNYLQMSAA